MNRLLFLKKTLWIVTFVAAGLILIHASQADAAIGKITAYKGEVVIKAGESVSRVTKVGALVNDGDTVTTQNGEANVVFNDGAILKLNPYTGAQIQERQEQSGVWIFKKTYNARRITCVVGKFWFKSGASDTRNTLQSPVAVATLKGSDGDFGFDNLNTYLNMYSGDAATIGNVIRGAFNNPGLDAASKSVIYQALQRAYQQTQQAQAAPANALKPVVQEQARLSALEVAKAIATALKTNPDATVAAQATQALTAVSLAITETQAALTRDATLAQQAGLTVPATVATTIPITTVQTTAASTTSTSTTSTTSTTSSVSTTTVCPSPPCR